MSTIGAVFTLTIICFICKAVIFYKRDVKPIWAFIPFANRYKLGKLVGSKKLAVLHTIFHPLFIFTFIANFGYELWIMKNYMYSAQIPENTADMSKIQVVVPNDIANIAIAGKYVLIGVAFIDIVIWCILMWRFTIQHDRNPWWILTWAIIPAIPYTIFALSNTVVIDGKKYTTKRIELPEKSEKDVKVKTKSRKKNRHESKKPA